MWEEVLKTGFERKNAEVNLNMLCQHFKQIRIEKTSG